MDEATTRSEMKRSTAILWVNTTESSQIVAIESDAKGTEQLDVVISDIQSTNWTLCETVLDIVKHHLLLYHERRDSFGWSLIAVWISDTPHCCFPILLRLETSCAAVLIPDEWRCHAKRMAARVNIESPLSSPVATPLRNE